jgi:hypothetical protein
MGGNCSFEKIKNVKMIQKSYCFLLTLQGLMLTSVTKSGTHNLLTPNKFKIFETY